MMLELKFKEIFTPKIPDWLPAGWWITPTKIKGARIHEQKPTLLTSGEYYSDKGLEFTLSKWDSATYDIEHNALFGDLPPEQCCFQQKTLVTGIGSKCTETV